ncbi:MAG: tRNA lysidine(34) synthetase TilS, partial [Peptostreptococcaceae bacterium]|nr:tRNA lysidine(34) synthetase TilS [Peptostreptococcaceae bacterium]
NITIHPVHINHKFRPVAAEEDQAYVENFCKKHGLECSTFIYDCNSIAKEQGISGEEAGRNARYEAFYKTGIRVMEENGIGSEQVKIAVAQNSNDQAETLLMRILRGTGPGGLAGIEYKREGTGGIEIIRPLLDAKRKDIERYCEENKLQPRFDHTNEQPVYTRNKIRLQLIPFIEKSFNPNITETLNRLSIIAKEDKDFMESIVNDLIKSDLGLEKIRGQHPAIRKRIIIKKFEGIGLEQGITRAHVEAADKLIIKGETGSAVHLPKGYRVLIDYGEVHFIKEDLDKKTDGDSNREETGTSQIKMDTNQDESDINRFDGLVLRTRQPGDYIVLKGVGGRKKIQDAFVDMKIKKEFRDIIPMLCRGSEVMWIIGDDITGLKTGIKKGRTSEDYQLEEETIKRIFVEFNEKM